MKLPLSISPCPIVQAVVEVRFQTDAPEDAVFGLVYGALKDDFPKSAAMPVASIPLQIRKSNPTLVRQPLNRLDNDNLTVLVGAQAVTVGIRGTYPGWKIVVDRFRKTFARIASTGIIVKPSRFGLRYISLFQGDILPNLTLTITIADQPVIGTGTFLRTVLQAKGCKHLLQVGKDQKLVGDPQKKTGSVIDIDSFLSEPAADGGFDASLADFLETAHLAEKQLFFKLLKPEFLKTLNPTYAHGN